MSIYDFSVKAQDGSEVSLADYRGKVLLVVNTATGFGLSPMGVMLSGVVKKTDKDYKNNGNIKWNFTKFLIDRSGEIVARFEPTDMKKLKERIEGCL